MFNSAIIIVDISKYAGEQGMIDENMIAVSASLCSLQSPVPNSLNISGNIFAMIEG